MQTEDLPIEAATKFTVELGARTFVPLVTFATYGAVHAGRNARSLARTLREKRQARKENKASTAPSK